MSKARNSITSKPNKRPAEQSQWDKYPLPFLDKAQRLCWNAKPSQDRSADFDRGRGFARQFLASCDGTVGWETLLGQIVCDMVRMGPAVQWKDGGVNCGSVVGGFFREISRHLIAADSARALLSLSGPNDVVRQ